MNKLRHILLQFNHGVEIGAFLAYMGHYRRTKDLQVFLISQDEVEHREMIKSILADYNRHPFWLFDAFFTIVGKTIMFLCKFSPRFMLNLVAGSMEMFAVFNYTKLADLYPNYRVEIITMAKAEKRHKEYFL